MKLFSKIIFCVVLLLNDNAFAGLMVTPNRLEFNDKIDNQEVKLINKSDEEMTYRISLQHLRMNEKGEYKEISANETNYPEQFADDLIRFSPKKITLKANEVQTVRVGINKSKQAKAADGEYRSHILFKEEPSVDFKQENNVEAVVGGSNKKISIVLKPLFGISIPVIVNKGEAHFEVTIDNMILKDNPKKPSEKILSFDVNRSGNASAFGNFIISFKSNKLGKKQEIGVLNSVSIFYPYPKRNIVMSVEMPKGTNLDDGVLQVKFVAKYEDTKNKEKIFAEGLLAIK